MGDCGSKPNTSNHPRFEGHRTSMVALKHGATARVAGRVVVEGGSLFLRDATDRVNLGSGTGLMAGDIAAVQGVFEETARQWRLVELQGVELLVRPTRTGAPLGAAALGAIAARQRMAEVLRTFFRARGFDEVETPNMVPSPGTDVHLAAFEAQFSGMGPIPSQARFLHTSPEFAMKVLLASGMEKIFQVCKVYRDGEWTAQHNPEFSMVEWYRAYADYGPIMEDVEALVKVILDRDILKWGEARVELEGPFERLTVREAFERHCGLDILELDTAEDLRARALEVGLPPLSPNGAWDDLFHELMLTHIEPHLGFERPTFLMDYPSPLAVLSRASDEDPRVAERFELYIAGVELCNGFTELNDPVEQRQRFEEDLDHRRALGYRAYPLPIAFLEALEQGMPPSGGVALGLDRLLMLAVGARDIGEVLIR